MQKFLIALFIVVAVCVPLWVNTQSEQASAPTGPQSTEAASRPQPPLLAANPKTISTLAIAEAAQTLNSSGTTIEEDFSTLQLLLSQYRRQLKQGNPVGDNAEITATLLGRNPKGLAYLPATGAFMDSQGRLIDRWGTPYFFHAISGKQMEIHSAGPDRKLHTADDLRSEF